MLQFLERFPVVWAELRPQTVGLLQKRSFVAFHQTTGKENERPLMTRQWGPPGPTALAQWTPALSPDTQPGYSCPRASCS